MAASGETTGIKWEAPAVMWVGKTAPLTVLTAGSPADLGSLTLPAWLTRYMCKAVGSTFRLYADTAAGTLGGATFIVRTAAAGGGTSMVATANGPTAAAGIVIANGLGVAGTGASVYFRQTANSANAGTITFSLEVVPI